MRHQLLGQDGEFRAQNRAFRAHQNLAGDVDRIYLDTAARLMWEIHDSKLESALSAFEEVGSGVIHRGVEPWGGQGPGNA